MDIKILVATHKPYKMPRDSIYLPIQVGKARAEDLHFTGDDTGENISHKNPSYCELTGVYWAWKNLDADFIGLAHYRRHFCLKRKGGKWESLLTTEEAAELCAAHDIILPKKRNYFIETNYSQYVHAHHREGLDLMLDIVKRDSPGLSAACDQVMKSTSAHIFNMFIMKKSFFDEYCAWLFGVLAKVEAELDISTYSPSEARVFGYLSERMLDIWLLGNSYAYKEVPVMFMERTNWVVKGGRFLLRKLRG